MALDDTEFSIRTTPQYEKCKEKLDKHLLIDLENVVGKLGKNQNRPLAKPLKGELDGKYVARFADQKYRLVFTINLNSNSITLLYLAPRAVAYAGKMW